jgi:hypothetical protein
MKSTGLKGSGIEVWKVSRRAEWKIPSVASAAGEQRGCEEHERIARRARLASRILGMRGPIGVSGTSGKKRADREPENSEPNRPRITETSTQEGE